MENIKVITGRSLETSWHNLDVGSIQTSLVIDKKLSSASDELVFAEDGRIYSEDEYRRWKLLSEIKETIGAIDSIHRMQDNYRNLLSFLESLNERELNDLSKQLNGVRRHDCRVIKRIMQRERK